VCLIYPSRPVSVSYEVKKLVHIEIAAYKFVVRFEIFTAVTLKNAVFWDVTRMAVVRTDVSPPP
jgi:hypothetical protein